MQKISRFIALTLAVVAFGLAAAATPQRGGKLVVALELGIASLDPLFGNAAGLDRLTYNLYAENLIYQDDKGKLSPWLAESWRVADDGLSITFKLRNGVTFQDGTPFDAQAVKFNLDRLLDPAKKVPAAQFTDDLASVDVVDPLTVRVNLKQRSAVVLPILAVEPGSMMSPTAIRTKGADFARSPIGTGPFIVTAYTGNQITTRKNPTYWRKAPDGGSLPYLDAVELKFSPNSAIRMLEMRSGNAHLTLSLQPKDFEDIKSNAKLALIDGGVGVTTFSVFNITQPPFNNVELRKAIALSIDREALEKVVTRGAGLPLKQIEPPNSWVYDDSVAGHKFDVKAAREAYQKSGHKGPLTLTIIQRDPDVQIAQLMQSMAKQAGIELKVEAIERQAWLSKILSRKFEMASARSTSGVRADPDITYTNLFGNKAEREYSGYDRSIPGAWIDQARVETDQEKRRKLYAKSQQWIADNYYYTYMFWFPMAEAASRGVQGIEREANRSWMYTNMWLEKQ